jgi:hypothetical protein
LQIARGQGKAHGAWKTPTGSLIDDSKSRIVSVVGAIKELNAFLQNFEIEEAVEGAREAGQSRD